jgi:hypothetical protein
VASPDCQGEYFLRLATDYADSTDVKKRSLAMGLGTLVLFITVLGSLCLVLGSLCLDICSVILFRP